MEAENKTKFIIVVLFILLIIVSLVCFKYKLDRENYKELYEECNAIRMQEYVKKTTGIQQNPVEVTKNGMDT